MNNMQDMFELKRLLATDNTSVPSTKSRMVRVMPESTLIRHFIKHVVHQKNENWSTVLFSDTIKNYQFLREMFNDPDFCDFYNFVFKCSGYYTPLIIMTLFIYNSDPDCQFFADFAHSSKYTLSQNSELFASLLAELKKHIDNNHIISKLKENSRDT